MRPPAGAGSRRALAAEACSPAAASSPAQNAVTVSSTSGDGSNPAGSSSWRTRSASRAGSGSGANVVVVVDAAPSSSSEHAGATARTRTIETAQRRGGRRTGPYYSPDVFLGEDLLAYLVLAIGGAMAVGSVAALVRPPGERREGDLDQAPVARSLVFAAIGLVGAIWALASLLA